MTDEFDPFAGESGLKSNYDGEVVDAFFSTSDFGLRLTLKIRDLSNGDETEQFYSCGPEWGSFDGGDTAEHPKSKTKGFNNATAIHKLVAAAFEAGGEEELRRRSTEQFNGMGPKAAKLWIGTRWHWDAKTETLKVPDPDNPGKRKDQESTKILPTKFLGAGVVTPTPAATPVSAGAQSVNGAIPGLAEMNLPDDQVVQIKVKAKTTSYGDWVDFVMALPGAIENGTLMTAIGDEAFYTALKEG